jgi:hypothetical protein
MTSYFAPHTVRDFERVGFALHPYCSHYRVCTHSALLPVAYLADHLGWDFDLYARRDELLGRLVCSCCGWRRPEIQITSQVGRPSSGGPAQGTAVPFEESVRHSLKMGPRVHAGGHRRRRWGRR